MYDAISLSELLTGRGIAPRLADACLGRLFLAAPPLPQTGRPGEPEHPPTDCLIWRGHRDPAGYGLVDVRGRDLPSSPIHQVVYRIVVGQVPEGLVLGHLCERRPCAHPEHVRPITRAENTREGASRIYADEVLSPAPPLPCKACGGATRVTLQRFSHRRPSWLYVCPPCRTAYRKGGGGHSGRRTLAVSLEVAGLVA